MLSFDDMAPQEQEMVFQDKEKTNDSLRKR